jgi:O-antigen ligase
MEPDRDMPDLSEATCTPTYRNEVLLPRPGSRGFLSLLGFLTPTLPLFESLARQLAIPQGVLFGLYDALILLSGLRLVYLWPHHRPRRGIYVAVRLFVAYVLMRNLLPILAHPSIENEKNLLLLFHTVVPYGWFILGAHALVHKPLQVAFAKSYTAGAVAAVLWTIAIVGSGLGAAQGSQWVFATLALNTNQNNLGLLFVIACALVLGSRAGRAQLQRNLLLAAFIIGTAVAFSRSAYLGLAATLVCGWRRSKTLVVAALYFVCLACLVAVPRLPAAVLGRVQYTIRDGLDVSTKVRIDLWKAALEDFRHNPIFGSGLGSWSLSPASDRPEGLGNKLTYAHNYFLTLLAQLGLPGLALGLSVLGLALRAALSQRRNSTGRTAFLVIMASVAASLFGEPLLWPGTLFAFLVVVGGVSSNLRGERGAAA